MKNFIDPTIDCVFKKILASAGNENLLLDFLNRILQPLKKITEITVLNPYNERDYLNDKLSVVDIKAQDETGKTFQIEIQMSTPSYLPFRMLHTWSDIYQEQLSKGDKFDTLKPVISIWLLTNTMIKDSPECHHHFEAYDKINNVRLADHMSIHVLELAKWHKPDRLQPEDFWLYFFKEGKHFKDLPTELQHSPQMRQAMSELKAFSDRDEDYHRYKARQQSMRIRKTDEDIAERQRLMLIQTEAKLEQTEAKIKQAETKVEQAKTKVEQAEAVAKQDKAKIQALEAMLRKAGVEPD